MGSLLDSIASLDAGKSQSCVIVFVSLPVAKEDVNAFMYQLPEV